MRSFKTLKNGLLFFGISVGMSGNLVHAQIQNTNPELKDHSEQGRPVLTVGQFLEDLEVQLTELPNDTIWLQRWIDDMAANNLDEEMRLEDFMELREAQIVMMQESLSQYPPTMNIEDVVGEGIPLDVFIVDMYLNHCGGVPSTSRPFWLPNRYLICTGLTEGDQSPCDRWILRSTQCDSCWSRAVHASGTGRRTSCEACVLYFEPGANVPRIRELCQ